MLLSGRFWLGGNDLAREDTWVWSATGETVTFFDWCLGLPSAQQNNWENQDCLGLRRCPHVGGTYFAWFDDACNGPLYHYICELMWLVCAIPFTSVLYDYCAWTGAITLLPERQRGWRCPSGYKKMKHNNILWTVTFDPFEYENEHILMQDSECKAYSF